MVDAKLLRSIPLFQRMRAARIAYVCARAQEERYRRGEVLFRQGEQADSMWVVLEGWVHLLRSPSTEDWSRAVVLFTITPRDALCGLSAVHAGRFNLSAVSGTDCRVIKIPGPLFADLLAHEPGFALEALRLCTRRMQHIAEQYGSMAEPVSNRIIRAILRLQQQFGEALPVTHRELAQMAWTTTESAIRVVRRLKRGAYLSGSRGLLKLENAPRLAHLLTTRNGHSAV